MLYTIKSGKPIAEIQRGLEESASRHQFGILAVHNLRETMKKKGVELGSDCWIYEVCNPVQAKKVLEADGALSTALPCRISVYGTEGAYTLATILPTALMKMFASAELEPVAQEVEAVIKAMMEDAAGAEKVGVPKESK
jgi:uncharacterized protein (DUF302 family)